MPEIWLVQWIYIFHIETLKNSLEASQGIAELLAQLQALDADESATDASVPMQQLLNDLELLELEDELQEMQGKLLKVLMMLLIRKRKLKMRKSSMLILQK